MPRETLRSCVAGFSNIEVEADVQIPTPPWVMRRQVWNSAFGYGGWRPEKTVPPAPDAVLTPGEKTIWNNLRWVHEVT